MMEVLAAKVLSVVAMSVGGFDDVFSLLGSMVSSHERLYRSSFRRVPRERSNWNGRPTNVVNAIVFFETIFVTMRDI